MEWIPVFTLIGVLGIAVNVQDLFIKTIMIVGVSALGYCLYGLWRNK